MPEAASAQHTIDGVSTVLHESKIGTDPGGEHTMQAALQTTRRILNMSI